MKRKVSIGIIIGSILAASIVLLSAVRKPAQEESGRSPVSEIEDTEDTEELAEASSASVSAAESAYVYVLRESGGWVVVCLPDSEAVCMETGIRAASLPKQLQERLADGIGFETEEELFDFLESYAS